MIEGTIALIDDNLHNPDYHELKNAEGEALRLIDKAKSAIREAWIFVAAGAAWACGSRIAFCNLQLGGSELLIGYSESIMMLKISRSVSLMPSRAMRLTLRMVSSTPMVTIPSPA